MNLEEIETQCLNYLRQSKKPIVSLNALHAHCSRLPGCENIDRGFLMDFIRNHGEVLLFEGARPDDELSREWLAEAGIDLGPRVMLKSRIPSPAELAAMMSEQLTVMQESLAKARDLAIEQGKTEQVPELDLALDRARALEFRVRGLQRPDMEDSK